MSQSFKHKFINPMLSFLHKHSVIIYFFLGLVATVGILTYLIFNVIWINGSVNGESMQPNFYHGDRVLAAPNQEIERGDIVVVDPPQSTENKFFLKRVVGMPNETISSKNDTTYIDGEAIDEPYLDPYKSKLPSGKLLTKDFDMKSLFGTKKIPKGKYFVMGDNRRQSADSRDFGAVSKSQIIGVVKARYWPLNRWQTY